MGLARRTARWAAFLICLILVFAGPVPGGVASASERIGHSATSDGEPLRRIVVRTQEEYRALSRSLRPGDVVVLANGEWRDFDLVFDAEGSREHPIYLVAETPGQAVLTGQSSLRLAGEYLVVSGLAFRDGYSPRSEVISFRRDSRRLANRSRVTQVSIENYSNPDRTQTDHWVAMYGRQNEFDHSALVGKLNTGATMVVRLNTEESRDNDHFIHHNYFGHRPVLGSNGGETLRIGTSHYSLERSGTVVESNFFERCDGEVEIVSNKSGGNTFRGNTFFRSRGTLTLRHGDGALIEGNLFDGDGALYTGGLRVINAGHVIRRNLFANLTGSRFSGGLVIMNGVPNSPINRYHQVRNVVIEDNIFRDVANIELGAGADAERTARPIETIFRNNTVMNTNGDTPFRIFDDMSGITFSSNRANAAAPAAIASGFSSSEEISEPADRSHFGVVREETGPSWYQKPSLDSPFDSGREIAVSPGENAIANAMAGAVSGDVLILAPGAYHETTSINLQIPLTVRGDAASPPVITWDRDSLFLISAGGALRLENLSIDGAMAPDAAGNSFIASTTRGGGGNHRVEIRGSSFTNFNVNRGFSVISAAKGTFFDSVLVEQSEFSDVSGNVFKFDTESDDFGIYNVEFLTVSDSTFTRIGQPVASVYRGGRDESTFGPHVSFARSSFSDIGGPLMRLHGVQVMQLRANRVRGAHPVEFTITTGSPQVDVSGNTLDAAAETALVATTDLRER